jgi:hypothetical protein
VRVRDVEYRVQIGLLALRHPFKQLPPEVIDIIKRIKDTCFYKCSKCETCFFPEEWKSHLATHMLQQLDAPDAISEMKKLFFI